MKYSITLFLFFLCSVLYAINPPKEPSLPTIKQNNSKNSVRKYITIYGSAILYNKQKIKGRFKFYFDILNIEMESNTEVITNKLPLYNIKSIQPIEYKYSLQGIYTNFALYMFYPIKYRIVDYNRNVFILNKRWIDFERIEFYKDSGRLSYIYTIFYDKWIKTGSKTGVWNASSSTNFYFYTTKGHPKAIKEIIFGK